ncbi:metallophosphoesterase [Bariatricus massiliensis]|uniref:Metallophosphoesterase n=1 Tax=Bariatricus massiliensis TaxID=1745713 RepID=A0ABS8DD23_9FIRM|nr:metallophosphoesterase [Bariatricus massiliensis]MCB7303488.1 metallophosphoesterase [Bariatricus massiliensis]MCB7373620.1 metallophosphoesterase [Bariatricus massiliensis]MCB7386290.1 metallophosphoesterase [Bariatricus massiliensis]MCB7410452.1 metallophosphoesterase [Bariatricus massiliensis]MCQ5252264.1 metallophosphoesterase [Bariatricus massiliensis]
MIKYMLAALCAAVVLAVAEIVRELHGFKVRHYTVTSPKLKRDMRERRLLFLSDLHNHKYGEHNEKLLDAVRRQKPDLILITGDMLVSRQGSQWEVAAEFVKQLPSICPVYYANGNHEQRMRENPEKYGTAYFAYKRELEACGVQFLINEKAVLSWDGNSVVITGLEVPDSCYFRKKRTRLGLREMERRVGKADEGSYQILLVHQPDFMSVYKAWGGDLILSGHLHGGIIRVPGLGGVISPQMGLFPKYSGSLYREEDTRIVVSKGLGTHTVNIRLFNPAELIVLHVRGER